MTGLRVGLVGDIHYGHPEDREMAEYVEPALEQMVESLNDWSADVVIGLGDFIEHQDFDTDVRRLQRIADIFDTLDAPFYAVPGNHDVGHLLPEEVVDHLSAENDEPYCIIDRGGRRLALLDTTHRDQDLDPVGGIVGNKQRYWLEDAIDTEKETYVFSHHLLHTRNLAGNFWFEPHPELAVAMDRRMVNNILKNSGVNGIFSAHIHQEGLVEQDGIPHTTLWAMNKFDPLPEFPTNHGMLTLHGEGFDFQSEKQKHHVQR